MSKIGDIKLTLKKWIAVGSCCGSRTERNWISSQTQFDIPNTIGNWDNYAKFPLPTFVPLINLNKFNIKLNILCLLSPTVHSLPHLTVLSLSGCSKITDDGVELIAENLQKLRALDLSWCPRITDASLEYIACDLNQLEELQLDRWVQNILEVFSNCLKWPRTGSKLQVNERRPTPPNSGNLRILVAVVAGLIFGRGNSVQQTPPQCMKWRIEFHGQDRNNWIIDPYLHRQSWLWSISFLC